MVSELTGSLKGGPGAIVTVDKTQEVPKHYRESMQYYHNVVSSRESMQYYHNVVSSRESMQY